MARLSVSANDGPSVCPCLMRERPPSPAMSSPMRRGPIPPPDPPKPPMGAVISALHIQSTTTVRGERRSAHLSKRLAIGQWPHRTRFREERALFVREHAPQRRIRSFGRLDRHSWCRLPDASRIGLGGLTRCSRCRRLHRWPSPDLRRHLSRYPSNVCPTNSVYAHQILPVSSLFSGTWHLVPVRYPSPCATSRAPLGTPWRS